MSPIHKVKRYRPLLRHTFVTTVLGAGVGLRDVQIAARHADPRTTMRYDRTCKNLDRHLSYVLAAYMASGIWRSSASPAHNPRSAAGYGRAQERFGVVSRNSARSLWHTARERLQAGQRKLHTISTPSADISHTAARSFPFG